MCLAESQADGVGRWVPLVRGYLNGERIVHGGELALTEHVCRAV